MGSKKNRWSEKDIKTMLSIIDKKGFSNETCIAVAKKIKRSSSAVQNKYRSLVPIAKKQTSIGTRPYANKGVAASSFEAAEAAFANSNHTAPEPVEPVVEIAEHAQEFVTVKEAKLVHYANDILILQVDKDIVIYKI